MDGAPQEDRDLGPRDRVSRAEAPMAVDICTAATGQAGEIERFDRRAGPEPWRDIPKNCRNHAERHGRRPEPVEVRDGEGELMGTNRRRSPEEARTGGSGNGSVRRRQCPVQGKRWAARGGRAEGDRRIRGADRRRNERREDLRDGIENDDRFARRRAARAVAGLEGDRLRPRSRERGGGAGS